MQTVNVTATEAPPWDIETDSNSETISTPANLSLGANPQADYDKLVAAIIEARHSIGGNFLTLGQALTVIKDQRLYEQGGFQSFAHFLNDKRIDIAPTDAQRFMAVTRDPAFERNLNMGLSKILELMKLPSAQRGELLANGATINGEHKNIQDMNLKEMKSASQELKRDGKQRCERCRRWVDVAQEIEGKLYGSGGSHKCFELELEERRALSAGRLPGEQLDQVLTSLRTEGVPANASPLQWLPESLYHLYGQLIHEQEQSGGEVTTEALAQEQETLRKLVHLCQNRLNEVQEMLKAMQAMDEPIH